MTELKWYWGCGCSAWWVIGRVLPGWGEIWQWVGIVCSVIVVLLYSHLGYQEITDFFHVDGLR